MQSRSLSKTEAKVILALEAEERELVTLSEIQELAGISPGFARKLAHGLVHRGWMQRVHRGEYLLNPSRRGPDALPDLDPFRLGSRLATPYYFGYATAAELHDLFPQASRVYYIASPAHRPGLAGPNSLYRFVLVSPSRFFGTTKVTRRGETLIVSDIERTVLDCLSRPELAGGLPGVVQILSLAKPRLDWHRFALYLRRLSNRSLELRAGFLTERVRPSVRPPVSWIRSILPRANEAYVPLDRPSSQGRTGPRDGRWHLIGNISDSRLFAEGKIR